MQTDLTQRIQPFAIYYGYPSQAGGCAGEGCAVEVFSTFPLVVLGDGLERDEHPEHEATRRIIRALRNRDSRVYGYVDLGLTTQGLTAAAIEQRLAAWTALGAAGVLFDDAGAEYGVSPARLNGAIAGAHAHGLSVIVNAGDPVDVFVPGSPLGRGDAYLFEAFAVSGGAYLPVSELLVKCWSARGLAADGVSLYVLATCADDPDLHAYVWTAAILAGVDAVGIAPAGYGATQPAARFLGAERPPLDRYGTTYRSMRPRLRGDLVTRETDAGQIWLRLQPQAGIPNAGFRRRVGS